MRFILVSYYSITTTITCFQTSPKRNEALKAMWTPGRTTLPMPTLLDHERKWADIALGWKSQRLWKEMEGSTEITRWVTHRTYFTAKERVPTLSSKQVGLIVLAQGWWYISYFFYSNRSFYYMYLFSFYTFPILY